MGYMGYSVTEYPGITEYSRKETVEVHVVGQCEMCGTKFDVTLTSVNGEEFIEYKCPCGYFGLFEDRILEDSHGIPKEEWQRRLKAKQAAAST